MIYGGLVIMVVKNNIIFQLIMLLKLNQMLKVLVMIVRVKMLHIQVT